MAAASGSDFAAFEAAEQAKSEGKPLARATIEVDAAPVAVTTKPNARGTVPAPAAAKEPKPAAGMQEPELDADGAAGTVENRRTRAEKDQQRINDAIRMGIEAGLAAHGIAPKPAAAAAAPSAADQAKAARDAHKRYTDLPDAPKLADYDSIVEHNAATAVFVATKMLEEQRTVEARKQVDSEHLTHAQRRVDGFLGRLEDAKKDPTFTAGLDMAVMAQLVPFGALDPAKGQVAGPANFVAEEVMDSEIAPKLLLALSKPGELARITAMPAAVAAIAHPVAQKRAHMAHMRRLILHLEGQLLAGGEPGATAQAAAASTNSSKPPVAAVPPPADSISRPGSITNPRAHAIQTGNFADFDRIEQDNARARYIR